MSAAGVMEKPDLTEVMAVIGQRARAAAAICSIERRSSSAAEADWVMPAASCSVAAAIRSSIFC